MKRKIKVEIVNDAKLECGFAAYHAGSARKGKAKIHLNLGVLTESLVAHRRQTTSKEWKRIVSDLVLHEMLHMIEDLVDAEYSEKRVNAALKRAREL